MPFQGRIDSFSADFSLFQRQPIPVPPQLILSFETYGNQVTFTWRTPILPQVQNLHLVTVSSKGNVTKFQVNKDAYRLTLFNFIWGEKYKAAIFPEIGSTLEPSEWISVVIGKLSTH